MVSVRVLGLEGAIWRAAKCMLEQGKDKATRSSSPWTIRVEFMDDIMLEQTTQIYVVLVCGRDRYRNEVQYYTIYILMFILNILVETSILIFV